MSDIEIAQRADKKPIIDLVSNSLGIPRDHLVPYGHYKTKLSLDYIQSIESNTEGKLILVTAMSPTPAGEGKTTTSVGLSDALNRIGKKTIVCLREPSLGPCFGIKGGAAGGGYAQVVPMEDINLHFTGDFHAIGAAHNLLAALLDNHIHQGNALDIDPRLIQFKRVVDMNDRALRHVVLALGGTKNGYPREGGFDITVASEVMAIFCLATSLEDLKERLGRIVVAYTRQDREPITAAHLKAQGAMAALLRDAISPNVVQTLENNLAFVHGGPFANIAHGCNSLISTKTALKLADYVVTEAGFGADLGAEKFIDIKCRAGNLRPLAAVLVSTVRALKYHGGGDVKNLNHEDLDALEAGLPNLERHMSNITEHYGLPCVVCVNHFAHDTDTEIAFLKERIAALGGQGIVARHWADGGAGAVDLARVVSEVVDGNGNEHRYVYKSDARLWDKITAVATAIYCASEVLATDEVRRQLQEWDAVYGKLPVCIAKTQMSFSENPKLRGAPNGHSITITEVRLSAGAGFIVAIAGNMMTMPGLPKMPAAENIDVDEGGRILGLF